MQALDLTTFETVAIWAVLGTAVLGLFYAVFLRQQILREDMGTEEMLVVADKHNWVAGVIEVNVVSFENSSEYAHAQNSFSPPSRE